MDHTSNYLYKLSQLSGFKLHCTTEGTFTYEANGVSYNSGYCSIPEGVENAYLFIVSELRARELVKRAKVTLE
jgi:hypothetical protein